MKTAKLSTMKKKIAALSMAAFALMASTCVYASGTQVDSIINSVTSQTSTQKFGALETTIKSVLGDGFVLTRLVVIGLLAIYAVVDFSKMRGAADNPQLKLVLKAKLLGAAIAIVAIANLTKITAWFSGVQV